MTWPAPVARRWLATVVLGLFAAAPAAGTQLESLALRARIGEKQVLGQAQTESFRYFDLMADMRLPWQLEFVPGWGIGTRIQASGGVLEGAGKIALVAGAVPVLALGRLDGRITIEAGAGLALFSNHRFGQQTFGGPLQFALTLAAGIPLYGPIGAGFRYLHYSDAGFYGNHTIGTDFQIVELRYHF